LAPTPPDSPEKNSERRRIGPTAFQGKTDEKRDPERDRVAEHGQPEQSAPEPLEVDLETREEQEEGETERAQDCHRFVDLRPVEALRPDGNTEQDLEHDRRKAKTGSADR
jgi:hypothetical protein